MVLQTWEGLCKWLCKTRFILTGVQFRMFWVITSWISKTQYYLQSVLEAPAPPFPYQ